MNFKLALELGRHEFYIDFADLFRPMLVEWEFPCGCAIVGFWIFHYRESAKPCHEGQQMVGLHFFENTGEDKEE